MKQNDAVRRIKAVSGDVTPRIGIILGSGFGHLTDLVDGARIGYQNLPGFPSIGVSGHTPTLAIGKLEGVDVVILGGRAHYYEHGDAAAMRAPLEVLRALGVQTLFATNSGGSLDPNVPPGDLMLISDHISFSGANPLIGVATDQRFVDLVDAYDPGIRTALLAVAAREDVPLKEGVYAWYPGPNFGTPAEIRALKMLGANSVGMSTVPEVILGRFLGLKCCAISVIASMAAGLGEESVSHEQTKAIAPLGAAKLEKIIRGYLRTLPA